LFYNHIWLSEIFDSYLFDSYLDSKCNSYLIKKSNRFFFVYVCMYLCYHILLMFFKKWTDRNSRLTIIWNYMTHLVLTQNFIPLKTFSSVNIISFPHVQFRKLGSFDVFLHIGNWTNEQILQKEALFCLAKRIFVFKIYFYKSLICSQRCS